MLVGAKRRRKIHGVMGMHGSGLLGSLVARYMRSLRKPRVHSRTFMPWRSRRSRQYGRPGVTLSAIIEIGYGCTCL